MKTSSAKRGDTISAAFKKLNDCPLRSKPPSINSLAKDFGLSETTLRHAVTNGSPPKRLGAPNVLTSHEENQLVGYCINMQKLRFGLTKWGVNHCVMEMMKLNK